MSDALDHWSPYNRKNRARAKAKRQKIVGKQREKDAEAIDAHYVARDEMQLLPSQVTAERVSLWDKAKDMSASELRATVRKGGGIGVMQLVELVQNSYDEQIKAAASKALVDASVAISKIELPILQMQAQSDQASNAEPSDTDKEILSRYALQTVSTQPKGD